MKLSFRQGYTLVEILLSTVLTLAIMAAVVRLFGDVGRSVSDTRAVVEIESQLRAATNRNRSDLECVTAQMLPPRRPESGEGYFVYIEGPRGPATASVPAYLQPQQQRTLTADTTVGDQDDMLIFTARSHGEPFVGRFVHSSNATGVIESDVAEIAWFVRGNRLYRRVLLVAPTQFMLLDANNDGVVTAAEAGLGTGSVFERFDISIRAVPASGSRPAGMIANTLADLTKPECRFAHQCGAYPYSPQNLTMPVAFLGLPLLCETASSTYFTYWYNNQTVQGVTLSQRGTEVFDAWENPYPWTQTNQFTGVVETPAWNGPRLGEDVILDNVIGFDVKAWDPSAPVVYDTTNKVALQPGDPGYFTAITAGATAISVGAYVDLGYAAGISGFKSPFSGVGSITGLQRVYDTWSFHYEYDGIREGSHATLPIDAGTNGFDDNSDGVVDDVNEMEALPPYSQPLRGIQIKIRVFEPDSKQIREVTVTHDFLAS